MKNNKLGLERINKARAERGHASLGASELVPFGAEALPSASAPTGPQLTSLAAPGSLPAYVDNSTLNSFPPIRSQGSLNSCGQFSAVYYVLTHMTALARNWNAKTGGDTFRFSPKWTYNVLNGGANVGSWTYDAYAIAIKHGLATWTELPYDADYKGWCTNETIWRDALNVRAAQTGKVLDVDTATGLEQVKQLLVNGYVLNFATYINSWAWKVLANDLTTAADDAFVGKQCVYLANGTAGGHAMTIVGFNDDLWVDLNGDGVVQANEKGALRIANSWGTGWGEGGFCWMAYEAIRTRNPASSSEGIFWMDEATWVTARTSYTPQLIAQFKLNDLKRNQLQMTLGVSDTTASAPTTIWTPNRVLYSAGGAYAFDGSTIAGDGSFCLDLTDLAVGTTGTKRYYLGLRDSTAGDASVLKSFTLVDVLNGTQISYPAVPKSADGTLVYSSVDYNLVNGLTPPMVVADVTSTSANIGAVVTFDGSRSSSPNSVLVGYDWAFGDGQSSTAAVCQHAYASAGTFQGTLTVTDAVGNQASASFTVTVSDPNVIDAPSGLTATVASSRVTLRWVDNSDNETGFLIVRAPKVNKGPLVYSQIGSVGVGVTTYADTVVSGTYYYYIQAVNSTTGKLSAYSTGVSVRVR